MRDVGDLMKKNPELLQRFSFASAASEHVKHQWGLAAAAEHAACHSCQKMNNNDKMCSVSVDSKRKLRLHTNNSSRLARVFVLARSSP